MATRNHTAYGTGSPCLTTRALTQKGIVKLNNDGRHRVQREAATPRRLSGGG
ncbi:hypothetical protein KCP78_21255 [Salmonella enterica subsp. enterica]|nr:hypothetical protein KCP78_21255 [Salmonella enterica subsp. enterica]